MAKVYGYSELINMSHIICDILYVIRNHKNIGWHELQRQVFRQVGHFTTYLLQPAPFGFLKFSRQREQNMWPQWVFIKFRWETFKSENVSMQTGQVGSSLGGAGGGEGLTGAGFEIVLKTDHENSALFGTLDLSWMSFLGFLLRWWSPFASYCWLLNWAKRNSRRSKAFANKYHWLITNILFSIWVGQVDNWNVLSHFT